MERGWEEVYDTDHEPPMMDPDEFWDEEREEGFAAAEPSEGQFRQDRALDGQPGGPVLAMAVTQAAEGNLSGLGDNELLGAIAAAERVAGHAAWAANTLAAEYSRRNMEWDSKLGEEVIKEFGADDYAQEIRLSPMAAKANLNRSVTLGRMPESMRLARDGALDGYRQRIIAEETGLLDPALLGKADELIAKDAAGRTPGSLRNFCRKIVLMLDPQQAEERRKRAGRGRRVEFWPEQSGNITVAAREMSVAVAASIKQALTGWARIMRAAGIDGSMDNLRHDAAAALLLGRHPVTGASAPSGIRAEAGEPEAGDPFNPWGYQDFGPGKETSEPPVPASPVVNIHLVITAGTLDPRQDAPGWIPEFGNITGQAARDLITAGTGNPATRWCVTEVDPRTGKAVAHGCARGRNPWPPPDTTGGAEFVASLNLAMEPIAQHSADDGHPEAHHDPSRRLQHLIIARNSTCATPGCDAAAAVSDMEHRIPWEVGGQTSEHNLDPSYMT
jgi:hypothetical protein